MRTTPTLEQNLKALNGKRVHLVHIIKLLSNDHIATGRYEKELDDVLQAIKEIEVDIK